MKNLLIDLAGDQFNLKHTRTHVRAQTLLAFAATVRVYECEWAWSIYCIDHRESFAINDVAKKREGANLL